MGIIDFILNLAGLLLWLNWRAEQVDPVTKRKPATLLGTLRRADSGSRHWQLPSVIGGLLLLRALFYWQIGSIAHWSAKLDCGALVLSFPIPDNSFASLGRVTLFSVLSFGVTLAFFYLCLLLLSALDGPEPFRTFVRQQLGRADAWGRATKLFVPLVAGAALWWMMSWLFQAMQIIPRPASELHRIAEAFVVGLGSYLAWPYVIVTLVGLHLLNSYIYFGKHPFWDFVNAEARTVLAPLKKVPLRIGRLDFAPMAGIILVLLIAQGMVDVLGWLCRKLGV